MLLPLRTQPPSQPDDALAYLANGQGQLGVEILVRSHHRTLAGGL